MVDTGVQGPSSESAIGEQAGGLGGSVGPRRHVRLGAGRRSAALLVAVVVTAGALAVGLFGGTPSVRASTPLATSAGVSHPAPTPAAPTTTTTAPAAATPTAPTPTTVPVAAATTPAPPAAPAAVVAAPAPVATAPTAGPTVATLVGEVEATGIRPGATWSWTMGDTATECGVIPGNSVGTGCTFGAAGSARTVFSGTPSLALVAHELANAETENDAVPSLMAEVTAAEAGTSWSAIDAVATCLVAHFMGFQDHAAGAWQCPAALGAAVAATIDAPA